MLGIGPTGSRVVAQCYGVANPAVPGWLLWCYGDLKAPVGVPKPAIATRRAPRFIGATCPTTTVPIASGCIGTTYTFNRYSWGAIDTRGQSRHNSIAQQYRMAIITEAPMRNDDLYPSFVRLHILHHASVGPVFGLWIIEELARHGYRLGPGTLYPILHNLERGGYLTSQRQLVNGRVRRVYTITPEGRSAHQAAKVKVRELFSELWEEPTV